MKWIRPLQDEQAAITDSALITQSSQMLHATGFHPFYLSLVGKHVTRSKGVCHESSPELFFKRHRNASAE